MLPKKEQKVFVVTGLLTYLSTAEVRPLWNTPNHLWNIPDYAEYVRFRTVLLQKIQEFMNDPYVQTKKNYRMQAILRELCTYLVQDDIGPFRSSERQKQRTVRDLNSCFAQCDSIECMNIAADLKKWSAVKPVVAPLVAPLAAPLAAPKPVSIKVKVLPRRSARLLARRE